MSKVVCTMTVIAAIAHLVACGGGDDSRPEPEKQASSSTATSGAGPKKDSATATAPAEDAPVSEVLSACPAKGASGNAKGVGAYCDEATPCGASSLCSSDFGAKVGSTYCTKVCEIDSDCGAGARCRHEADGATCELVGCK